ncbi:unnamed protein product, partial [Polarella glacialis]
PVESRNSLGDDSQSVRKVWRRHVSLPRLVSQPTGGPVVAVTHGGVLGQLLRHADIGTHARHTPTNACISRFLVRPGRQWDILSWAAADHLSGDCAPVAAKYD